MSKPLSRNPPLTITVKEAQWFNLHCAVFQKHRSNALLVKQSRYNKPARRMREDLNFLSRAMLAERLDIHRVGNLQHKTWVMVDHVHSQRF